SADRSADPRARIELLVRLAQVLQARGKLDRAAQLIDSARQQAMATLPESDPTLAEIELALIDNLVERGKSDDARPRVDRLLARLPDSEAGLAVSAYAESAAIAINQHANDRALADADEAVRRARALGTDDLLYKALRSRASSLLNSDRAVE